MPKSSILVWHYTTLTMYDRIKRSGELRAKKVVWYSERKPVVWFTSSPSVDPLVRASLVGFDRIRPIVRIGTPITSNVLTFETACKKAGFMRDSYRRLREKAGAAGANVHEWYGVVLDRLPLDSLVVEFYDEERDDWVSTRHDLIDYPEGCCGIDAARWAARMGLLCEQEFFDSVMTSDNYGLRLYAKGYAAGDVAYWDWDACLDPTLDEHFCLTYYRTGFMDRIAHLIGALLPVYPLHAKVDMAA